MDRGKWKGGGFRDKIQKNNSYRVDRQHKNKPTGSEMFALTQLHQCIKEVFQAYSFSEPPSMKWNWIRFHIQLQQRQDLWAESRGICHHWHQNLDWQLCFQWLLSDSHHSTEHHVFSHSQQTRWPAAWENQMYVCIYERLCMATYVWSCMYG